MLWKLVHFFINIRETENCRSFSSPGLHQHLKFQSRLSKKVVLCNLYKLGKKYEVNWFNPRGITLVAKLGLIPPPTFCHGLGLTTLC